MRMRTTQGATGTQNSGVKKSRELLRAAVSSPENEETGLDDLWNLLQLRPAMILGTEPNEKQAIECSS